MNTIGSQNGSFGRRMVFFSIYIMIVASIGTVIATSADATSEIVSGSTLVYDSSGHIKDFSIWISFPEPIDPDDAGGNIEIRYTGNSWFISDPDMPFHYNWSDDQLTLSIFSGNKDLSDKRIYSLGVSISNPIKAADGNQISFGDRSSVELVFGDPNRIDLDMGFWEIFTLFVLPFVLLMVVVIATEIVLRVTYRSKKMVEKGSTTEILLKLIDRSESWMKRRSILATSFVLLLIAIYIIIAMIAILNLLFAMIATILLILFVVPWILFLSLSILYFIIRKEDLYWKRRLIAVRKSQTEFMRSLDKE